MSSESPPIEGAGGDASTRVTDVTSHVEIEVDKFIGRANANSSIVNITPRPLGDGCRIDLVLGDGTIDGATMELSQGQLVALRNILSGIIAGGEADE